MTWLSTHIPQGLIMSSCCSRFFSDLRFRLRFFFLGLRFYETTLLEGMREISKSDFVHDNTVVATCTFYRMDCTDHVMRLGRVFSESYQSYVVKAEMKVEVPPDLQALNGKYFFFNGVRNRLGVTDNRVSVRLLDLFLSFVLEKLRSNSD